MSSATPAPARQRSWTAIGSAVRVSNSKAKRATLLKAAATMAWTDTDATMPTFDNPAVAFVVRAVFTSQNVALARVGKADLPGHQALIGLEDTSGIRCYVVEDHSEAVYVLLEHPARTAA